MIWSYPYILSSVLVELEVFGVLSLLFNLFFLNDRLTWDFLKEAVTPIL
jgi:hypothetical protein